MTRTDRRRLLQRLAFSESRHFSWDTFPPIPWPMTMVYLLLKQFTTRGKLWCSGRVGTEATVARGSDPAGVVFELPRLFGGNSHSEAALNVCPDVSRVHWLPQR